jgi:hypothetical protein
MFHARSVRFVMCLLLVAGGLATLPASPVAAQNCATIAPGAFLAGCDLAGMDLSGVNLAGANLRGANLEGATLDGANLSGANLSNARITEGALDNANTSGANLRGIRWIAPDPTLFLNQGISEDRTTFEVTVQGFDLQPGSSVAVTTYYGTVYETFYFEVPGSGDLDAVVNPAFACGSIQGFAVTATGANGAAVAINDVLPIC